MGVALAGLAGASVADPAAAAPDTLLTAEEQAWVAKHPVLLFAPERDNADATRVLEDAIRGLPEVISCHYISGAGTFELQVLVTDLDAYSRWTMETLFRLPNVKDLHTSFSLGEIKSSAALPLGHLGTSR